MMNKTIKNLAEAIATARDDARRSALENELIGALVQTEDSCDLDREMLASFTEEAVTPRKAVRERRAVWMGFVHDLVERAQTNEPMLWIVSEARRLVSGNGPSTGPLVTALSWEIALTCPSDWPEKASTVASLSKLACEWLTNARIPAYGSRPWLAAQARAAREASERAEAASQIWGEKATGRLAIARGSDEGSMWATALYGGTVSYDDLRKLADDFAYAGTGLSRDRKRRLAAKWRAEVEAALGRPLT